MYYRNTAIIVAAGKGTRMGGELPKQYMDLGGKPLLSRTVDALGSSPQVSDIVIVIPAGDEAYVQQKILTFCDPSAADKVRKLVPGGKERYESVYRGIKAIEWACMLILIHDGARPFIDHASIDRLCSAALDPENDGAAIAGMPSKDTVKIANESGRVVETPDRDSVWIVQTPQVFRSDLITDAYERLRLSIDELLRDDFHITDDAMVVETLTAARVCMVKASYRNIKITTPEDLAVAEAFLHE